MKKIFYNANIITMKNNSDRQQAMLVEDGYIKKIGTNKEILELNEDDVEQIDMNGLTIMPSFTNINSNLYFLSQSLMFCDLSGLKDISSIEKIIKNHIKQVKITKDNFIIAIGLDEKLILDKAITCNVLDQWTNSIPIIISNTNATCAIVNDSMINLIKQNQELKDFKFDKFGIIKDEEFKKIINYIPNKNIDDIIKCLVAAQNIFFSFGITTCQDNIYEPKQLNVYVTSSANNELKMDVVANLEINAFKEIFPTLKDKLSGYSKNFRIAGLCLDIDGMLVMNQALNSKPYNDDQNKPTNNYGILVHKEIDLYNNLDWAFNQKTQLCIKANGDKALDLFINYLTKTDNEKLKIARDKKIYILNCLANEKQIDQLSLFKLGYGAFGSQLWYFSDIYSMYLNKDLYNNDFLKLKSLNEKSINLISYQNASITLPNMFELIWSITNRKSRSLSTHNPNEKLSAYDAFKTITINPSFQLFEESRKSKLLENKYADFIVIEQDPLNIDVENLSSIKVLETYKRAERVFKRK